MTVLWRKRSWGGGQTEVMGLSPRRGAQPLSATDQTHGAATEAGEIHLGTWTVFKSFSSSLECSLSHSITMSFFFPTPRKFQDAKKPRWMQGETSPADVPALCQRENGPIHLWDVCAAQCEDGSFLHSSQPFISHSVNKSKVGMNMARSSQTGSMLGLCSLWEGFCRDSNHKKPQLATKTHWDSVQCISAGYQCPLSNQKDFLFFHCLPLDFSI